MPGLVAGSSPLKIQYSLSLPHSLLSAVSLMCAVPEYAGLDEWLAEARAGLPAGLRDELGLLVTFAGRYGRLTEELAAGLPVGAADWDFERLLAHWQALPPEEYQHIALAALSKALARHPARTGIQDLAGQPAEWADYLAAAGSTAAPDAVGELLRDGQAFKARLVTALERFWREAYAGEFEATRPLMERSVSQNRAQRYSSDFRDVFVAVTGRLLPDPIAALLPTTETAIFMPSCYVGPYVAFMHYRQSLILFYNCRSAASAAVELPKVGSAALYPPLKALADETRLQILALLRGRELYAQEIVSQLDISQPAVSRHLNLMVAAGVLRIRREGNAKYYAVNGEVLAELAGALAALV